MAPFYATRPENALKRAKELLAVSKQSDALDVLHDVIKSRRSRVSWTKDHEAIIMLHVELCVELRKPHVAKDGLWQYRNICQQTAPKSLEDVVIKYLELAENRAEQAREQSQGSVEDVIDDLDVAENPENLLLSVVSGADAKDRADRTILSPWLRFLWESYRQCLELLKNNNQVELLYHRVARQAFEFCKKYQRRAEFRKLCDNLRSHLVQLQKYPANQFSVKLSNPETLMLLQETRLYQLDVAIQMELWQEAFKSSEDVHSMIQWSRDKDKRMTKPQTIANYYEKLALVFWKAGNKLYHAAALFRLFQHYKDMKKTFSQEDQAHQATRVLLATLCIPAGANGVSSLSRHLDMEETWQENQRRLAALLDLNSAPSRQSILRDMIRFQVLNLAHPSALALYRLLEQEFSPLRLASQTETELKNVQNLEKAEYVQYVDALRDQLAAKVVKQTISLERLRSILPSMSPSQLERMIVQMGKRAQLNIRVDHRAKSIEFLSNETLIATASEDNEQDEAAGHEQHHGSDLLRTQLQSLHTALKAAVDIIEAPQRRDKLLENCQHHVQLYNYHKADDYRMKLSRRSEIEHYKEQWEHQKQAKVMEEMLAEQKRQEERLREEKLKLEANREEIVKKQKIEREEEMKRQMRQNAVKKLESSTIGKMVLNQIEPDAMEQIDADDLIRRQIEQWEKEKKEVQQKQSVQEKKWDYYVRACAIEEIPLRQNEYEEWKPKDREYWDNYEQERVRIAQEDHALRVDTYERLQRMKQDTTDFMAQVRESRKGEMNKRIEDWKNKLDEMRKSRLEKRKDQRKKERRDEWEKRQEEERRRRETEEAQKKLEEDRAKNQMRRRPAPGGMEDRQMDRDMPSRADEEGNWRGSARPTPAPPPRPGAAPGVDKGPAPAERESDWRGSARAPPPPGPARDMGGAGREIERRAAPAGPPSGGGRYQAPGRGPPGDDFPPRAGGPPPEEDQGPWRRGITAPARGPPEEAPRGPPPQDEGPWRRGGPPPGVDRAPRRDIDDGPRPYPPPVGDDRGPYRDERGPPRDVREEREPFRDERGPPRDERGPPRDMRDERGPPPGVDYPPEGGEDEEGGWMDVPARRPARQERFDDEGGRYRPPAGRRFDDNYEGGSGGGGRWGPRGGGGGRWADDRDRAPPPQRRMDDGYGDRDGGGGGRFPARGPPQPQRGRFDDEGPEGRDSWRGGRDGPPPRDGGGYQRGPPRDDRDAGGAWRRDGPPRGGARQAYGGRDSYERRGGGRGFGGQGAADSDQQWR